MDFVYDYDDGPLTSESRNDSSVNLLPIPAPPLNLPNLNVYREDLSQKFSNLNILKNLQQKQQLQEKDQQPDTEEFKDDLSSGKDQEQNQLALKYAQISLDLIKEEDKGLKLNNYITANSDISKPTAVLSTRLARVLNTSNFDSGIGEALSLLQDKIQQQQQHSNSTDEENVLNIDYNTLTDAGLVGSVSRRKLRNEIETDLLRRQFQTLKTFQPFVKKLEAVKEKLDNLNELNEEINSKLADTSQMTKAYRDSVSQVDAKKDLITLKKQLLKNFQKNFSLTRYEEFHLINEDIDEEYLTILAKAETIHKNCSILLSLDNPNIGIAIMNQMKELIQLATKRILNFIKKQFQSFFVMGNNSDLDSESKHAVFKKSLVYIIKNKQDYLSEIMDELITSRSKILVEDFLEQVNGYSDALQKQDDAAANSVPSRQKKKKRDDSRPLMLSIYDSKRFLGDILAYLHDIIVNERELLNNMFDMEDDVISSYDINDSNRAKDSNVGDIVGLVDNIIERNLEVLTKPLRSKIEQIIRSESKLVVLQSIYQLFDLYKLMYSKALKSETSTIIQTIQSLEKMTSERVLSVTKAKLHSIQYKNKNDQEDSPIEDIDDDLNIPEWLFEFYGTVSPLLDNFMTTPEDQTFMNLSKEDNDMFESMIYDKVLELLEIQILQNQLKGKARAVFKLNCYDFISSKLITVTRLSTKWRDINEKIEELKKDLISSQFQLLLKETNLQDIYNLINMIFALDNDYFDVSIYEPITENKMFNFNFFKEVNFRLMEVLPLALIDYQQKELAKILLPSLSNDISIESSIEFVNFYYKLWIITKKYLKVVESNDVDTNNFGGHPVFKWSDAEIAMLLACDEHYLAQKESYEDSDRTDDDDTDNKNE